MTRIFFTLAVFSLVLMVAALTLGLWMGDLYAEPARSASPQATVHRLTGVGAALAVVLVNSIVVTYFIGTSRWCKEVVQTYGLDASFIQQSTQLKRRTFPWALLSMLVVVGVSALGAASDPMANLEVGRQMGTFHLFAALAGVAFIGWSYLCQWNNIYSNYVLISEIMREVQRVRGERGLPVA